MYTVGWAKPSVQTILDADSNDKKNEHSLTSKIKSISYLDNILAKKEAMEAGYDEAILLNLLGNIADGSMGDFSDILASLLGIYQLNYLLMYQNKAH